MKNLKLKKALKVYGVIGKVLCMTAGGIVGFTLGGPLFAITGVIIGGIVGHLLEKGVSTVFS